MPKLRPYQQQAKADVYDAWRAGHRVVGVEQPTGGGKTVLFSDIARDCPGGVAAVAHRSELVSQMSIALARNGLRHRVIGPRSLQKACTALHMNELKRNYVDPGARVAAVSVDTLNARDMSDDSWRRQVQLCIEDEAHHVLRENKWGRAFDLFPSAWGLGVSATWRRADGKGLGRHADGIVDYLIPGPSGRELINEGYLTDYRVVAQGSRYDNVRVSDGGELNMKDLRAATHADDRIVGDVVKHYLKFAAGKLGITFAVDVEAARELAAAYRAAGVPAEVVTAKTPDTLRYNILQGFKARQTLQLVNVDLFGEGFDLPAIQCVSMARKTESFALFAQQFGRALRLMITREQMDGWDGYTAAQRIALIGASDKPHAWIIDHVGNILRHGLPDKAAPGTLDRRERGSRGGDNGAIPLRACPGCLGVYERFRRCCPECGFVPTPIGRGTPEQVDGDLQELDPAILAALRGEVDRIDGAPAVISGSPEINGAHRRQHFERQQAQSTLRRTMHLWSGYQGVRGITDQREQEKLFYLRFKTDVLSAMGLGRKDAEELAQRVQDELNQSGVVQA